LKAYEPCRRCGRIYEPPEEPPLYGSVYDEISGAYGAFREWERSTWGMLVLAAGTLTIAYVWRFDLDPDWTPGRAAISFGFGSSSFSGSSF